MSRDMFAGTLRSAPV